MRRLIDFAAAYTLVQAMSALAILDRVQYGEWAGKGGDALTQAMNFLSIAASLLLLVAGRRTFSVVPRAPFVPLAIVGLFFVSAAWSMDPAATARRAVNYAIMVAGALGMAYAMSPLRIMRIAVQVCTIAAVSSLILRATPYGILFHPETGETDFRGVFSFKNMLGEAMVAGVLSALYCYMTEPRRRIKYALRIVLYLVVIVAAQSATSLLICVSYIELLAVMALYARGGGLRVLSLVVLGLTLLVGGVIAVEPNLLFGALGKDSTMSGRTDLWAYVIQPITEKPFFGWGFNGFWVLTNPAAVEISDALQWTVPEAHNGLLECMLQVGVLGTGLVLTMLAKALRVGMRCISHGDVNLGRAMIVFLFGLLVMSISEAILLTPSQIPTLQLFLYFFMCEASLAVTARTAAARVRAPASERLLMPRQPVLN